MSSGGRRRSFRRTKTTGPDSSQLCEDIKTETSEGGPPVDQQNGTVHMRNTPGCMKEEETLEWNIHITGPVLNLPSIKDEETENEGVLLKTSGPSGDRARQTSPPQVEHQKSSVPDESLPDPQACGSSCTMQRVCQTPEQMLDFLWNIDEMESEDEQCVMSDGDDEREDACELNLMLESDSDSESDCEVVGDSVQEARDGTVWVEEATGNPRGRARERSTMNEIPGPTCYATDNITNPLSSLMCLFDVEMWETIQKCTEGEAERNKADKFKLTADELKAFVGLIYLRGITGGKNMKLDDYWSTDLGNPIFLDTMARQKFRDIMRYLRFDDKKTRAARLVKDKFAMISEVFSKFVKNSIASYTPCENMTVDEYLIPTKARCRFTRYMANKPDKFGIKLWVAADLETKYMLNAVPDLGNVDSRTTGQRLPDNVVMRLVEPFLGKGRNVTIHNTYTSLSLASDLLSKKTTTVGVINKNRREMPPCTQAQSRRFSTKVLRAGKVTLTVYQAKPKKNVCILSTMHQTVSTDSSQRKLPNTLSYYKSTKDGVHGLDQMARQYSVKGGSRRWPVAVFYSLLDLAAINAHILYKQCMKVSISRRKFILELVKELCAKQRMAKAMARRRLLHEGPAPPAKRKQCQVGRCSGNKTYDTCQTCKRFVCGKCTKNAPKLCFDC